MKSFNWSPPVWSLSVSFSHSYSHLLCQYNGLHNSAARQQNAPSPQYFFYTSFGWPKFAYVANPIPPETRCMTYKLHSQQRSPFHFSILPVLYTQDTFAPFSNFEVGHFAHHFLFLSVLLWKEFNSHSFVVTFHLSCAPPVFYSAVDDCWVYVNVGCSPYIHSTPLTVSLNNEPQLAHRRQQSVGSAFQFHYT